MRARRRPVPRAGAFPNVTAWAGSRRSLIGEAPPPGAFSPLVCMRKGWSRSSRGRRGRTSTREAWKDECEVPRRRGPCMGPDPLARRRRTKTLPSPSRYAKCSRPRGSNPMAARGGVRCVARREAAPGPSPYPNLAAHMPPSNFFWVVAPCWAGGDPPRPEPPCIPVWATPAPSQWSPPVHHNDLSLARAASARRRHVTAWRVAHPTAQSEGQRAQPQPLSSPARNTPTSHLRIIVARWEDGGPTLRGARSSHCQQDSWRRQKSRQL